MSDGVRHEVIDGVGWVWLDVPGRSMNVLNEEVLHDLIGAIETVAARDDVRAVVVRSAKPAGFCAGADVTAIANVHDAEEGERLATMGQAAYARVEQLTKPVVAAIHGPCMGGGLELALACHGRIASHEPKTRIGLPEVQIGILPGFGGTQRMTREVGLITALDLILTGKGLNAKRALRAGLVDDIVCPFKLDQEAAKYATELADQKPRRGSSQRKKSRRTIERFGWARRMIVAKARASVLSRTRGVYPAPLKAIETIELAADGNFADGYKAEAKAIGELLAGPVSHHLVNLFLTMEELKKRGGDAVGLTDGDQVGVVGAGVMGADIAELLIRKGARVRLFDVELNGLQRGVERIAGSLRNDVKRGRLTPNEAVRVLDRLAPSTEVGGLRHASFAIEVVVERLDVKERVFVALQRETPADAPIYTNTSSIPVASIGRVLDDPSRVLGLHFFNPVAKMPLVEVVVPEGIDEATLARGVAVARDLGKVPVVVRDSPGFLVNRVLAPYLGEALQLLEEGIDANTIDNLMLDLGFPMGPLLVVDTVGLDVANHVAESLSSFLGDRLPRPTIGRLLNAEGHLGAKSGGGIFVGKGAKRKVAPWIPALVRRAQGEQKPPAGTQDECRDRLYLTALAESARAYFDQIVSSPRHLDAAMILGAGFPASTGGPLREIDEMGATKLVDRLQGLAARYGDRFLPGDALIGHARSGATFHSG